MPQNNRSQLDNSAAETRVRQLIAAGKHKAALDSAKEIHKAQHSSSSEALLIDAYLGRIQSLLDQNLTLEAKSLMDLVRERYPAANARLAALAAPLAARRGALDELVRPLLDPALTPEHRAAIEQSIQREVTDLEALARALPSEHPLAEAALALHRAFQAVTTGPVPEEEIALPQVSHRNPLAPWKLLIRAIAAFYRGETTESSQLLQAIKPDSVPSRLIPSIEAMLAGKPAAPLAPAASHLFSQVSGSKAALHSAFQTFDETVSKQPKGRVLKAVRGAVQECNQTAPHLLQRVKQHIAVRCMLAGVEKGEVDSAMAGAALQDAYFERLFARAFEMTPNLEDLVIACSRWDDFKQEAVHEGWFKANGIEVATLYLHMAELLKQVPQDHLRQVQRYRHPQQPDDYFVHPDKLYQRACAIDPHSHAFAQWLQWGIKHSRASVSADSIAEAWHKALPRDMQPVLHLMKSAEKRKSLQKSIQYLVKAEQLDGVHPEVRRARLRLSAASVQNQIHKKNQRLAAEKIEGMAALPQAHQGDRPAYVTALRYMLSSIRSDEAQAAIHRAELVHLLDSNVAAALLIHGVAGLCKRDALEKLGPVDDVPRAELPTLPAAVARVTSLAADMEMDLEIPWGWIVGAWKQFPKISQSLDTVQIRTLGELAVRSEHFEFAYAASAAGLQRNSPLDARFLLLRAQSLIRMVPDRSRICATAAAELAREQRDLQLLDEAVQLFTRSLEFDELKLTPQQAAEILQIEKAESLYPKGGYDGPDYDRFLPDNLCQCPECRAARLGQDVDPFDDDDDFDVDDDDEFDFPGTPPANMPPEIAAMLLEEAQRAMARGEGLDEFLSRMMNDGPTPRIGKKKGKRR